MSLSQVAKELQLKTPSAVQKILQFYGIKRRPHGEGTRLLHKHLDIKPPKCFPFHLKDNFHKLIAVFLLTDGNLNGNCMRLICTDKILQAYFASLFTQRFKLKPSTKGYMQRGKDSSINSTVAAKELRLLSPNYTTYPRSKTKKEYPEDPQPTLAFLENENEEIIIESIRIAMSCEGSIYPEFVRDVVYPTLQFSCAHPGLLKQWQKLFKRIGINTFLLRSKKTWSGVKSLGIKELKSIKRFIEIGGFIEGVEITGKSTYYEGIQKNDLLKLLVRMREESFYFPRGLSNKQKNEMIRKMIENSSKKEKYWKECVEKPEIRVENKKKKIRSEILEFIRSEIANGYFPTRNEIEERFKVSLVNYFGNKTNAYREAGLKVENDRRIIRKPRPLTRDKIVAFIRGEVQKGHFVTREEIERTFGICFSLYFPSILDAYDTAEVKYPRSLDRISKLRRNTLSC